ncbi:Hypothetical protein D9617_4g001810 [Elsinoe fawcettii]|nr:Hypothetical protein D9617_4g001810 [Elsinoe fawcettii]
MLRILSTQAICLVLLSTVLAAPLPTLSDWTRLHDTKLVRPSSPYESSLARAQTPLKITPGPREASLLPSAKKQPDASPTPVSVPATYFQSWLSSILKEGKVASCEWSARSPAAGPVAKCNVQE